MSQAFEDTSGSEAYSIADNKGKQQGGGPRSFTFRGREWPGARMLLGPGWKGQEKPAVPGR